MRGKIKRLKLGNMWVAPGIFLVFCFILLSIAKPKVRRYLIRFLSIKIHVYLMLIFTLINNINIHK